VLNSRVAGPSSGMTLVWMLVRGVVVCSEGGRTGLLRTGVLQPCVAVELELHHIPSWMHFG
jgi:hypothetical protein